ncbi:MAG: hypothetical protein GY798_09240 [Hyphomicrobiales bacterium]|nr:hypothetical protein [Hyphomicrobiales bacterium]
MFRERFAALGVWLVLAIAGSTAQALADQVAPLIFLPAGSVDAAALVGPPPEMDSDAFETQMTVVLWLQLTRTPEQVAFVEQTLNVDRFAPILGDALFSVDGAALKKTIDTAIDQVRNDYDALKGVFDLPRPFQVNDAINPVGDARPVASHPSGHSIRAIVYARLLSEVFPEHADALMTLAEQIGLRAGDRRRALSGRRHVRPEARQRLR